MMLAIFNAIAAIPALLSAVEKLAAWITEQAGIYRNNQALKAADEAAKMAKEKKDTSDLDRLFDPGKPESPKNDKAK